MKKIVIFGILYFLSLPVYGQQNNNADGALPSGADVAGFVLATPVTKRQKTNSVHASSFHRRQKDGAQLLVSISVYSSEQEAIEKAKRQSFPPGGRMPSGSMSKRTIGQNSWYSQEPKGQKPKGAFQMIVQDGRTMLIVSFMLPIIEHKDGKPVERQINQSDLMFVENTALKCLDKLSRMGYTKVHKPK